MSLSFQKCIARFAYSRATHIVVNVIFHNCGKNKNKRHVFSDPYGNSGSMLNSAVGAPNESGSRTMQYTDYYKRYASPPIMRDFTIVGHSRSVGRSSGRLLLDDSTTGSPKNKPRTCPISIPIISPFGPVLSQSVDRVECQKLFFFEMKCRGLPAKKSLF